MDRAAYDYITYAIIQQNKKVHAYCVGLREVFSQWMAEPIFTGIKIKSEFTKVKNADTNNQLVLAAEEKFATDYKRPDLAEVFGLLVEGQKSICEAEAELVETIKSTLIKVINNFLRNVWPPVEQEINQLEEYRLDYEQALAKLLKHPSGDKKTKIEKATLIARHKFVTKLPEVLPILKQISVTEDALVKAALEMSESFDKYYAAGAVGAVNASEKLKKHTLYR